ncbi:hypothetical protein BH11MYX1_BH11MYX1_55160 [soil metagenome]
MQADMATIDFPLSFFGTGRLIRPVLVANAWNTDRTS